MKRKYFILLAGVLIVVQLLIYNQNQAAAIDELKQRKAAFDGQIRSLKMQKLRGEKELRELAAALHTLRPWLASGFKDPEQGFVKFLDFLGPELKSRVNANVSLAGARTVENNPIPLQKTSYKVTFDFKHPHEAERFLTALLVNHEFPLRVNSADFTKVDFTRDAEAKLFKDSSSARVGGQLSMDLVLPASLLQLKPEILKKMGVI